MKFQFIVNHCRWFCNSALTKIVWLEIANILSSIFKDISCTINFLFKKSHNEEHSYALTGSTLCFCVWQLNWILSPFKSSKQQNNNKTRWQAAINLNVDCLHCWWDRLIVAGKSVGQLIFVCHLRWWEHKWKIQQGCTLKFKA